MLDLTCPRCGGKGDLEVISGVFRAKGLFLTPVGFNLLDAAHAETESVCCRCTGCRNVFMLTELKESNGPPQARTA